MTDRYHKASAQVLTVERSLKLHDYDWETARPSTYVFDFEFRVMTAFTSPGTSSERQEMHPFPSLDAEVLERMRNKLIELGGKPDPLVSAPETKPAFPAPRGIQKGLNP